MASQEKTVSIKDKSVLHLKINQAIPDRSSSNALDIDIFSMELQTQLGLNDILDNLEKAKQDDKIKGIFLEFGFITPGIASMEEIREALVDFKGSGKFIIAYSNDIMSQSAYYLATVADKIYLNPVAIFELRGLRSELIFYKQALEKLGVEMQIVKHGNYKSATESFTRENMSDESREQIMAYINAIWDHMLSIISSSRGIPVDRINQIADNLLVKQPEDAVKLGLVDGLMYRDEILDELLHIMDLDLSDKLKLVSFSKYTRVPGQRNGKGLTKNKIAVVYATGVISNGSRTEYEIGGPTFVKAIRAARKDSAIKAIVLRVNSPGGSAMISDHIWREVLLARETKPLIASMGNVAASGGYFILAPAGTILCNQTTITGSIGAFASIPNARELLNQKLGISFDVAKTNKYSDFGSVYRPLNPMEKEYLQASIEKVYSDFVSKVSAGRQMPAEEVIKIAEGRVWSGTDALKIGLADQEGGLRAAINLAAEKAGLERYRIVTLPEYEDPLERILKTLTSEIKTNKLKTDLGLYYKYYKDLKAIIETNDIQMRMPFSIDIY